MENLLNGSISPLVTGWRIFYTVSTLFSKLFSLFHFALNYALNSIAALFIKTLPYAINFIAVLFLKKIYEKRKIQYLLEKRQQRNWSENFHGAVYITKWFVLEVTRNLTLFVVRNEFLRQNRENTVFSKNSVRSALLGSLHRERIERADKSVETETRGDDENKKARKRRYEEQRM